MKKILSLAVLLMTVFVGFTACSDDDDDNAQTTFTYAAPCINWHCSLDEVRSFMKTKSGFTEDKTPDKTSDGMKYYFRNKKETISYSYTIADDGLVASSVSYDGMNKNFDALKQQITTAHGIAEWQEMPEMSGVKWWTTKLTGKKTSLSIGKSDNYGGYMYADFSYTEFDW